MRIAALDDEPSALELIESAMRAIDHECHTFTRGDALMHALRRETFDLLVLDWQLPKITGIEVVQWVRTHMDHRVPILMLTSRATERDIVEGLSAGADDYMIKPIRVGELVARARALLRRCYSEVERETLLETGSHRFDLVARQVSIDGVPIELKRLEFDLAVFLFRNIGRLVSRGHLVEAVWGQTVDVGSRSLDTHVSRLRTKLELRPQRGFRLSSIYNHGYRLEMMDPPPAGTEEP
ncbi:response regulator transcription factor [Burkholderiaceae bacterium UC74_6]